MLGVVPQKETLGVLQKSTHPCWQGGSEGESERAVIRFVSKGEQCGKFSGLMRLITLGALVARGGAQFVLCPWICIGQ